MKFEMEPSEFQDLFKNTKLEEFESFKNTVLADLTQIVNYINNMQNDLNECRTKLDLPINVIPVEEESDTTPSQEEEK